MPNSITYDQLIPFPLIVFIFGGHEPQKQADILQRVRELDEDTRVLLLSFMVDAAREEVSRTLT